MVRPLQQPDDLERGPRPPVPSTLDLVAAVEQRQFHVFDRARPGEQVEALEDETDAVVADFGQIVARHARHVLPSRMYFPAVGLSGSPGCA